MKCPDHIKKFAIKLPNNNEYTEYVCDDYHIPYLIKCICGCTKCVVLLNCEPQVNAKCTSCGEIIPIYNLKYYPATALIPCDEECKEYISPEGDTFFNICVVYEYPELEKDEEFNPNDITFCEIFGFGLDSGKYFCIISDETA